jgi:hypothetical protein
MELIAVKILIDSSTGLLQDRPGNVDLALVACLLGGSISAALAGSFLGTSVVLWLRRPCTIRRAANARMLSVPALH